MPADLSLRQVGETYKDYAARMAGCARAAEIDRDRALDELQEARAEVAQLSAQRADVAALHQRSQQPFGQRAVCQECCYPHGDSVEWPCPTAEALGVTDGD